MSDYLTWDEILLRMNDVADEIGKYRNESEFAAHLRTVLDVLAKYEHGYKGSCYACEPCGEKNVELEASTAAMQPIIDAAIAFVVAENMDPLGPYVAQRRRTLNALHDEVGKYLEKDL